MTMMLAAAPEAETFVTHLECGYTGELFEADKLHNLSSAGKPLLVRYDLDGVKGALTKDVLKTREPTLWRYRELLPVRKTENCISLGEIMTPTLPMPTLSKQAGSAGIFVKDEGRLPTGSFKARGLIMAVSMAKGAWREAHGDADQRQCRGGYGSILQPRRDRILCVRAGRHARNQLA